MQNHAYLAGRRLYIKEMSYYSRFIIKAFSEKCLNKLEEFIGQTHVGFLSLQINAFYKMVKTHGAKSGFQLLSLMDEISIRMFEKQFQGCNLLYVENVNINQTVICFQMSDEWITRLPDEAASLRLKINQALRHSHPITAGRDVELRLGYAYIPANHRGSFYESLFRAFCNAKLTRLTQGDYAASELRRRFNDIRDNDRFTCVYQPIINLKTWRFLGWEGFIRGPESSYFHKPDVLFAYADELNQTYCLDERGGRFAIQHLGPMDPDQRLFLKIHPRSCTDPGFHPEQFFDHGLAPKNLVIETTEPPDDMTLLANILGICKDKGCQIAVRLHRKLDVPFIDAVRPDYIKITPAFIRETRYPARKKALIEGVTAFCDRIGVKVIAVGIETASDIKNLAVAGVYLGQGNYLAQSAYPKPMKPVGKRLAPRLESPNQKETQIGELVKPALIVKPDIMVSEVKEMLNDQPPLCSIVVVDKNKPVGLMMSYQMDRLLGTKYGVSLFFRRTISYLMDSQPLIVNCDLSVGKVAGEAMVTVHAPFSETAFRSTWQRTA